MQRKRLEESEEIRIQGFWPWFLQRFTGVLLVFFLGIHIWVNHFMDIGEVESGRQEELVLFDIVRDRLKTTLFIFIDFSLLALVLYHGLNGIRNILLEWNPARLHMRAFTISLVILGTTAFFYGGLALLAFIL